MSSALFAMTSMIPAGAAPARIRAQAIFDEWAATGNPDTLAVLERFPQLRLDKSLLLELAYEEYVFRTDAGDAIDPDEFCERFPDYRASLREIINAHGIIEERPAFLDKAPAFQWPAAGDRLGEYFLQRTLGLGGFARVFLATHALTGRRVVVKVSPPNAKEPRVLGGLDHPNVVPVLDARILNDTLLALVMPYVGSSTLTDVLDEAFQPNQTSRSGADVVRAAIRNVQSEDGPPPADKPLAALRGTYERAITYLASEMAHGLAYLHGRQICHLDLKPSNVVLTWAGKPVIVDFNLAVDSRIDLAHCGGTLYYMAPEQIRDGLAGAKTREPDPRGDVFAFGVIVYELLTGRHPFSVPSSRLSLSRGLHRGELATWLLGQQRSGCLSLLQHAPAIDPRLARLVMRCLNFEAADRPASAAEIARELDHLGGFQRRWRKALLAGSLAAGLLVSAAGYRLANRPPLHDRVMTAARADITAGHNAEAIERLESIATSDRNDPNYFFLRGLARMRSGDAASALQDFEASLRLEPRPETHAALAYCYAATVNYEAAIHHADLAGALADSPAVRNNRAMSILSLGKNLRDPSRLAEAMRDLDRALAGADFSAGYYNRSLCHFSLWRLNGGTSHLNQAIADTEQAIERNTSSCELRHWAVDLVMFKQELRAEDWIKVETWLRQAIELGFDKKRMSGLQHFDELKRRRFFDQLLAIEAEPKEGTTPVRLAVPLADLEP